MSGWKAKRFWTEAKAVAVDGGWQIELVGRLVRSPAKTPVIVPTQAVADAIAAEWNAQTGEVRPETMPVTRFANSALDKVMPQFDEVCDMLAAYGGSDLLCYRADAPQELQQRQAEAWDPILDWLHGATGVRLAVTKGVMPIAQASDGQVVLRGHVGRLTAFEIAAFHDLVTISGSLAIALAVSERHLAAEQAWLKSRVDEVWQEEQWGPDEEATEIADLKKQAFLTAAQILADLRTDS